MTRGPESSVHAGVPFPRGGFPGGDGREGPGALVGGLVVRESVTLAGLADRTRVAREFVRGVLGEHHPRAGDALLMVSELFGNSVRHSGSAAEGETVTVAVRVRAGVVRVEVTDRSGGGVPEARQAAPEGEGGRGLDLVGSLAVRWGTRRRGGRRVTWFEVPGD